MKKMQYKKILYISYDGVLDPLGQSQVLEYIYVNSNKYNFYLVSFEKSENLINTNNVIKLKNKLLNHGIKWTYLKYQKKSNVLKIFFSFIKALLIIVNIYHTGFKIIHIRSYIPGIIIYPLLLITRLKLIFDIRGFLPDEKIDRLNWKKNSLKIFFLRYFEKYLIKRSSKVITLTKESKHILKNNYNLNNYNIIDIPTCVNIKKFKYKNIKQNRNLSFCFIGSVNFAYDFNKIINLCKVIYNTRSNIKFDFYLDDKNNFLKNLLKKNNLYKKVNIKYVESNKIPSILIEYDYGICILKQNKSVKASFPTKIGEYLSCGLPIICNNFNKDITLMIKKNKLGIVLDNNFESKILKYIDNYHHENNGKICRDYAEKFLSLEFGSKKYSKLYNEVFNQ